MAVEFGQEKSGAGSFRGSADLCLTKAAPLFVFSRPEPERERAIWRKSVRGRSHFTLRMHDRAENNTPALCQTHRPPSQHTHLPACDTHRCHGFPHALTSEKNLKGFQIIQPSGWVLAQTNAFGDPPLLPFGTVLLRACSRAIITSLSCLSVFPRVLSRSPTSPPRAWLPILQPTPQRAEPRGRWADMGTDGSGAPRPGPRPVRPLRLHLCTLRPSLAGEFPRKNTLAHVRPLKRVFQTSTLASHRSDKKKKKTKNPTGLLSAKKPHHQVFFFYGGGERTRVYVW